MGIDLGSVTDAYGKSKIIELTTANITVLTNANNSSEVFQLHSVVASNFSNVNSNVSLLLNKNGTLLTFADQITMPANTNLSLVDKTLGMYLEANDSIIARAGANSTVSVFTSYNTMYAAGTSPARITAYNTDRTTATSNGNIYFTITTANIPPGTILYYQNIGTASANTFRFNSGASIFTVNSNFAGAYVTISSGNYAGNTVILQTRMSSDNGYVLSTSPTVTLT